MSKVLVNFIQDRSGSMQSVWDETLNGFKSFVTELRDKNDGVEYLFSLTVFDTQVDCPIVARPISDIDLGTLAGFGPRGCTALYDAVGTTIKNTEGNSHGADKIIVVIVTDGQENSSREWTKEKLHAAIDSKLSAGNWTFTYLGTQPETWDDAAALGVTAGAVSSYTPAMAAAAYTTTAKAVSCLASSPRMATRSLIQDYVPSAIASAAGMSQKPHTTTTPRPIPKAPTPSKTGTGRWR